MLSSHRRGRGVSRELFSSDQAPAERATDPPDPTVLWCLGFGQASAEPGRRPDGLFSFGRRRKCVGFVARIANAGAMADPVSPDGWGCTQAWRGVGGAHSFSRGDSSPGRLRQSSSMDLLVALGPAISGCPPMQVQADGPAGGRAGAASVLRSSGPCWRAPGACWRIQNPAAKPPWTSERANLGQLQFEGSLLESPDHGSAPLAPWRKPLLFPFLAPRPVSKPVQMDVALFLPRLITPGWIIRSGRCF